MTIRIDYVSDWSERLRGRLYTQFRDAVTWNQWIDYVLAPQAQALEDAGQELFGLYDIDASEGAQLDLVGRLVGQPRAGLDDATYRLYLRARIIANRSSGGPEELYAVMRALFGQDIGLVVHTSYVKAFEMRVKGPITPAGAVAGRDFLGDAKEAGARGIIVWQEVPDAEMFYTAYATYLGATAAAAATTLTVFDASAFPATGTAILDYGTVRQESVTFTRTSATNLTVSALSKTHAARTEVEWTGATGLGFDAGRLAGALRA